MTPESNFLKHNTSLILFYTDILFLELNIYFASGD